MLGHGVPAPSSHRFLLFACSLFARYVLDFWVTIRLQSHCFEFLQRAQTYTICIEYTFIYYFFLFYWPPDTHLAASPLLPTLHFPLYLTELLLSSVTLWRNRRGSFFYLSLFDTRFACSCILLAAASCLKWTLHTVTGLTLHCCAHSLHTEVRLSSCTHTRARTHTLAH